MAVEPDFFDPGHRRDPVALHHRLLAERVATVEAHDPPFLVVSHYDDVTAVLRDVATWSSAQGPGVEYTPGGVLGSADRPDHTRQRRVLAPAFTPLAMSAIEPRVAALADDLFDRFLPLGRGDFVELYAGPLPAIVIAELLGVEPEARDRFRAWSDDIVAGLGGRELERAGRSRDELMAFVLARLDERAARLAGTDPAAASEALGTELPDDVLSRMVLAAHDQGRLGRTEMAQLALMLLVAGHETTTSLLGLMVLRLIEQPHLVGRLRSEPALQETFVEEMLRFDSPVQGLFRTATSDVELAGTAVPAGTKVQVMFAAANRDPAHWPHPDELDVDRPSAALAGHVAFGHGIHRCIGAPLARMEARLSLRRIIERMDELSLDGEPEPVVPFILRGWRRLPIRWTQRGDGG